MKTRYCHLTLADRRQIERCWRQMRMSATEITRRLGRPRSAVFRELRRNRCHDAELPHLNGCWCMVAQRIALGRRFRHRKIVRHPELRDRVTDCLRAGWSPEQIAGRIRFEAAPLRISQETICQFVCSGDGRAAEMIMARIAQALQPLPRTARCSVTFDCGSECVD